MGFYSHLASWPLLLRQRTQTALKVCTWLWPEAVKNKQLPVRVDSSLQTRGALGIWHSLLQRRLKAPRSWEWNILQRWTTTSRQRTRGQMLCCSWQMTTTRPARVQKWPSWATRRYVTKGIVWTTVRDDNLIIGRSSSLWCPLRRRWWPIQP